MPRVSNDARPDRDDLVVTSYLTGRSFRAIGRDPRFQLSDRGARLAVRRGLVTSPPPKHLLERLMADAYQGSVRGDVRAKEQLRRLQRLIDGGGVRGARTPVRGACPECGCTHKHRRRCA
ncbi:hypothetical protein HMPREF0591_6388 [Mycobacterium parascrofulaceum ATCC BAA-614]|uniref:Uncharacterized protein n=1 Tax=Mycobacterium parascrofulaceum ATCC BAA-614 TaxID=525368 RepID=D5PJP4_9MYCO|nr:hypothetical protein [Mycobacterium parascrofulaceum]EFG73701.1 hypothetical protein HMPREF0591_6388 [Mycobacterium parascrofulaceum ATCC BAA-614]